VKQSFHFDSKFSVGIRFGEFDEIAVKNEPMLFNCDAVCAYELGGAITRSFLDAVGERGAHGVFDSRVHMLMPGWYPCIPGWHHDDVPRSRSDGQPNYVNPEYRAKHVLGLVNGDICPTQFAVGSCDMPDIPIGKTIYERWNDEIDGMVEYGLLKQVDAPSNQLVFFDCDSFHRGTRARGGGWRWFGRLSVGTGRKPSNELRRQVQVYMPVPTQGW
jgi:hypothetical protein